MWKYVFIWTSVEKIKMQLIFSSWKIHKKVKKEGKKVDDKERNRLIVVSMSKKCNIKILLKEKTKLLVSHNCEVKQNKY